MCLVLCCFFRLLNFAKFHDILHGLRKVLHGDNWDPQSVHYEFCAMDRDGSGDITATEWENHFMEHLRPAGQSRNPLPNTWRLVCFFFKFS